MAFLSTTLKVIARLCAWIAIAGAPSTRAKTSPSDVEAQKLTERPTTAFKQTEPLGAGVILILTPSASKYLSCSATQIAPNAKFGTAVMRLTSGISFCARAGEPLANEKTNTAMSAVAHLRDFIFGLLSSLGSLYARCGPASEALFARSARPLYPSR